MRKGAGSQHALVCATLQTGSCRKNDTAGDKEEGPVIEKTAVETNGHH